jgi:drug/metabolite transporter (DMT)-like permease
MLLLAGLACALLASVCFNLGVLLQALEARDQPKSRELRLSLLAVLLRRPRWTLGLLLGLVGVLPQVLALALAPFAVVQPALSAGLLLLLAVGTRTLGEPVRRPDWLGVVAIIGGIALVAAGSPTHAEAHRGGAVVIVVALAPLAVALLPFPLRGTRFDSAALVLVASGLGFASANIATKLMGDDVATATYGNAAVWAGVALAGGIAATITNMTAFQRRPATMVVPLITAVQTYVPIVLEPLFLRESWSTAPIDGAPIAAGLVLAAVGTTLVARTRAVGELTSAASGEQGKGHTSKQRRRAGRARGSTASDGRTSAKASSRR